MEIVIIIIAITSLLIHIIGKCLTDEDITPHQIIEKELTPKEKESIASIISRFEKEAKRTATDKELAFVNFAVKSWRLHQSPSWMTTLTFKEGQSSFDASVVILDISILMQWEKDYPEDYKKFKQTIDDYKKLKQTL